MREVAQYHTIPLPKGWPRRVRSAVIQVISLARIARRISPSRVRTWPSRHRLLSPHHHTRWTITFYELPVTSLISVPGNRQKLYRRMKSFRIPSDYEKAA